MSLDPTMERQTERMVEDLCSEFAGQFERSQIEQVMSDSVERVLAIRDGLRVRSAHGVPVYA